MADTKTDTNEEWRRSSEEWQSFVETPAKLGLNDSDSATQSADSDPRLGPPPAWRFGDCNHHTGLGGNPGADFTVGHPV